MTRYYQPDEYETWIQARIGKVTASRLYDALAKTKSGWSASRRKYMVEIIAERMTGMAADRYWSESMQWGIETEAAARKAYERRVEIEVGHGSIFVDHPEIPHCGCSPDGFVAHDGLVEIKCPESRTHISTLLDRVIEEKYRVQMQWQLAVTGREWCDYVSYDPRMPEKLALHIERVHRDDQFIKGISKLTVEFLQEIDRAILILSGGAHMDSEQIASDL